MHVLDSRIPVISSPVKRSHFQYSVENLRGLAILFVVLSHITSIRALGPVGEVMAFVFHDATALFVFISGYLFHHIEQKRFDYRSFLKKKAKFVILPYLILSVPGILLGLIFDRHIVMGLTAEGYSLWSLIVGGAVIVPMWFVPMIALFFLASPLFHRLGNSRILPAIAVLALGVSLLTNRPVENMNPFLSMVHFGGFYVFGIFLSVYFEDIRRINITGALIVGSLALFACAVFLYIEAPAEQSIGFTDGLGQFSVSLFGKLTLLIAIFCIFDRFLNMQNRFLSWMAEISFGLFFMHGFFMLMFIRLKQKIMFSSPLLMLVIELCIVLGGAMLAVIVVKKIVGKKSRYVIGC